MDFQLDVGRSIAEQWTCGVRARGEVVMMLQYLKPPFDSEAKREEVWSAVNEIVGGNLEKRLTGRPTFPLAQLKEPAKLQSFLAVLDRIIDGTIEWMAKK